MRQNGKREAVGGKKPSEWRRGKFSGSNCPAREKDEKGKDHA